MDGIKQIIHDVWYNENDLLPEERQTIENALREQADREKGCAGCKVYAALQRYHRLQEQCTDCKGCIRIAKDRYQEMDPNE